MVMGKLVGIPDELVPVCRSSPTSSCITRRRRTPPVRPAAGTRSSWSSSTSGEVSRVDDLLTALLAAEIDGEGLGEDELLGFGWLLLVGGNDTTTNLIGNGLELFARHPDQRRRLAEDPGGSGAAVEEVLRYASPASLPRTATRDVEMHGEVIRPEAACCCSGRQRTSTNVSSRP